MPPSVRRHKEIDRFWYETLYFLILRRDLRLISVWNPSFLTIAMNRLPEWGERLAYDLASSPESARRLTEALRAQTPAERHVCLWPELRTISCWANGNSAPAARALGPLFPQAEVRGKGLVATEGFVSLPLDGRDGSALAIRSHFPEFIPVGEARPLLADELERGAQHRVVLTTSGGLYRYDLGDVN